MLEVGFVVVVVVVVVAVVITFLNTFFVTCNGPGAPKKKYYYRVSPRTHLHVWECCGLCF